jgi:hypothetical protein
LGIKLLHTRLQGPVQKLPHKKLAPLPLSLKCVYFLLFLIIAV